MNEKWFFYTFGHYQPCCANADDRPHGVNAATKMFSLIHRSWSAVARLLYDASESSQLRPPKETFSPNELYFYIEYITDLARKVSDIEFSHFSDIIVVTLSSHELRSFCFLWYPGLLEFVTFPAITITLHDVANLTLVTLAT